MEQGFKCLLWWAVRNHVIEQESVRAAKVLDGTLYIRTKFDGNRVFGHFVYKDLYRSISQDGRLAAIIPYYLPRSAEGIEDPTDADYQLLIKAALAESVARYRKAYDELYEEVAYFYNLHKPTASKQIITTEDIPPVVFTDRDYDEYASMYIHIRDAVVQDVDNFLKRTNDYEKYKIVKV